MCDPPNRISLRELTLGADGCFQPTARNMESRRLALLAIANIIPSSEHEQRGLTALLREFGEVSPYDTS